MFGGSADPYRGSDERQSKLADTASLQFCKYMYMNVFRYHNICIKVHVQWNPA